MMTANKSVAELFKELNFEKMSVDTTLAKEYLSENEFLPINPSRDYEQNTISENDEYGTEYKVTTLLSLIERPKYDPAIEIEELTDINKKTIMLNVAKGIEENAVLISQLDYLLRRTNPEEVINYDIPMLLEKFKHPEFGGYPLFNGYRILKDTPLATFGFLVSTLQRNTMAQICATADTAAVSTLIATICIKAGWPRELIQLEFFARESINAVILANHHTNLYVSGESAVNTDKIYGSAAVVTAQADLDSSVLAILHATHNAMYPWKIRRVFVQEAVYERFKGAIASKTNPGTEEHYDGNVASQVREFGVKVLFFDYSGSESRVPHDKPFIFIEAYRTTKELMSLLKRYSPNYLSVWCNNASISNQVAYGSNANIIWINEYGVFNNHAIGKSFYECQDIRRLKVVKDRKNYLDFSKKVNIEQEDVTGLIAEVDKVKKLRSKWIEKDFTTRKAIILNVLGRFGIDENLEKMVANLKKWESVSVNDGSLCVGLEVPVGVVLLVCNNAYESSLEIFHCLNILLMGNGLLVKSPVRTDICETLQKQGVPVVITDFSSEGGAVENIDEIIVYEPRVHRRGVDPKVVFSRFGETFAN